jgi:predicted metallopeptidase
MMDKPNLVYASESFSKLGSYEYGSDTIYISTIFKNLPPEDIKYLDYVMYHELLHKKHTFKVKNGRHQSHTTAFRKDEELFSKEHNKDMEDELGKFLRRKRYSASRAKSWFKIW